MREAVSDVLDLRATFPDGWPRLLKWSIGIHLTLAASVVAWQTFLARPHVDAPVMTVSLAGSAGPVTGGMTSMGGRQVDEVAPPPRRPEPTPAVAPKPDEMTIATKPAQKPVVAGRSSVTPAPSVVQTARGSQITSGTSIVETGARGEGTGLSTGGAGVQVVDPKFQFCCATYLTLMHDEISKWVNWKQPVEGTVVVSFEVARDGTIAPARVKLFQPSGTGILDLDAISAVRQSHLLPLPAEYSENTLIVRVTIPYTRR